MPIWIGHVQDAIEKYWPKSNPIMELGAATLSLKQWAECSVQTFSHYNTKSTPGENMQDLLNARMQCSFSQPLFCIAVTLANADPTARMQLMILLDTSNNSPSAINNGLMLLTTSRLLALYAP